MSAAERNLIEDHLKNGPLATGQMEPFIVLVCVTTLTNHYRLSYSFTSHSLTAKNQFQSFHSTVAPNQLATSRYKPYLTISLGFSFRLKSSIFKTLFVAYQTCSFPWGNDISKPTFFTTIWYADSYLFNYIKGYEWNGLAYFLHFNSLIISVPEALCHLVIFVPWIQFCVKQI